MKALATDVAVSLKSKKFPIGMGRGEYASYFANLGAITVALGPMLYGFIYAWGRKINPNINLGFFAAAVVGCLLPEMVHQTITKKEMEEAAGASAEDKKA